MSGMWMWLRVVAVALAVCGAPGGWAQAWGLGGEQGHWRLVCSEGGEHTVEVAFPHEVGGRVGRVVINIPQSVVTDQLEVRISQLAWDGGTRVRWCDGSNEWMCDEAMEGELDARAEYGQWIDGAVGVRLRSGAVVRSRFRAQLEEVAAPSCT